MKKTVTIKENRDFRRMYQKGANFVTPYLVVYCRPNRLGHNRLGITVSTKLGHAVVRNRLRRQYREIFRLHQGELKQGYDVILVGRSRSVGASYWVLDKQFLRGAGKLGLLRGGKA